VQNLESMVRRLVSIGYIKSERVKRCMLAVDRARFVPERCRWEAYLDRPLPLMCGQTISAPHMVALMLELLDVEYGMKVLEIGTGSGYHACLLACLVGDGGRVVTVERIPEVHEYAVERLKRCPHSDRIRAVLGDGSLGFKEEAPYDRILVTCGAPDVPPPLLEQLADDGLMVIPVGGTFFQELIRVRKKGKKIRKERFGDVAFVPMMGKYGWR
jgi:protein-L-isoaspartate(D-aspartate) O-methyltransferase